MNHKPLFSIIIPVRTETEYLKQTLNKLKNQKYKNFEVLVITDKISKTSNPAQKRNLGAKMAKGEYLAFLDDDSYPSPTWLTNALQQLSADQQLSAVCGPCLTPPEDNDYQQASGLVWSSWLGSGGAGTYRNSIQKKQFVDDYPSVNLIVKKKYFDQIKGFNTNHWPGEDTILCHDLVYKLHTKILYHPSIIVYHHRRNVIIPHLKQITRYALHRGNFARILPKTSLKIGYLIPSMFLIYSILFLYIFFTHQLFILQLPMYLYILLLSLTFFRFTKNSKLKISLLATITIPLTHLYYGLLFIIGFVRPQLDFVPHQVDPKNNKYLGG